MKRSAPTLGSLSPPPVKRKLGSTTTSTAVNNFFKPASQKEREPLTWRTVENSLIIGRYEPTDGPPCPRTLPIKVAAFDLDDTLIIATGAKFARNESQWKWFDASVPGKLNALYNEGYLVVILSNQGSVKLEADPKKMPKDSLSVSNLKKQLSAIIKQLNFPVSFYGATAQDKFRKPRVGMWEEMLEDFSLRGDNAIDLLGSFYVGDAAGREVTDKRKKKDWASSDRDLASNIGIPFFTPEEFFLGAETEPYDHGFHPARYLENLTPNSEAKMQATSAPFVKNNPQDLVIFVGSPGAGKSTFFWNVLEPLGYERVNQDILKTRDKCIKKAREYLAAGSSVAVDNTNADVETRAHWVRLGKEYSVPVRVVRFTASSRLAEHNDSVRALNRETMNREGRTMLPAIAFRSYLQRLQEPTLEEGFQDIYKVDFEFKGTPEQKSLWSRFYVSKYST